MTLNKAIRPGVPNRLDSFMPVKKARVISMNIAGDDEESISMFSLSRGEDISEEEYHSSELYMVVSGEMEITFEGQTVSLSAGDSLLISRGTLHALKAVTDLRYLEISIKED